MTNSADPDQLASSEAVIWIYSVCKDRLYPGSAGLGLTRCMLGNFACFFFVICGFLFLNFFFQKNLSGIFSKKSFRNTIRVSNSLDPDQARHFVGPDLGPNCLQRLSADDKCHH